MAEAMPVTQPQPLSKETEQTSTPTIGGKVIPLAATGKRTEREQPSASVLSMFFF